MKRETINAVQQLGYTDRQAEFIAIATLNSGYFIRLQYNRWRGAAKGGKATEKFCRNLTERGHAKQTRIQYAFVYQVTKPVLSICGLDDNRYRSAVEPFSMRAKLMGLDYVLSRPDVEWLSISENARVSHFKQHENLLPTRWYNSASGLKPHSFVERFPIGIDPQTNRYVFVYIDDGVFSPPSFHVWLDTHAPLVDALGEVDVIHVGTSEATFPASQKMFAHVFSGPASPKDAVLKFYFETRRDIEENGIGYRKPSELDEYRKLMAKYAYPKYEDQYGEWLKAPPDQPQESGIRFDTWRVTYPYSFFGTVGIPA